MNSDNALIWSWLNILTKKRYDALLQVFSTLDEALDHINEELLKKLGCRQETIYKTLNRLDEFNVDAYKAELEKRDVAFTHFEAENFPSLLKQIPDCPVFLYYKGDVDIVHQPCIAVVGTREPSSYGIRVTESFVSDFVKSGLVTVSGLAMGIDSSVAQSTIASGGKTIAVLGHGMASIHPKSNTRLADSIIDNGGLLLSEFPLDVIPDKYTFPARNRIIAGLSMATVVMEAAKGSGALITAELASEYGRNIFAVPGNVFDDHYSGCHHFIATGQAQLAGSSTQILDECGIVASTQKVSAYEPSTEEERILLGLLTSMPKSSSELAQGCSLDTAVINSTLTILELYGAAKNTGNGLWVRM